MVFFSWKKMSKHTLDNRRLTLTLHSVQSQHYKLSTNDACGVKKRNTARGQGWSLDKKLYFLIENVKFKEIKNQNNQLELGVCNSLIL